MLRQYGDAFSCNHWNQTITRPIGRGLRALAVHCLKMEPSERPDLEQIEKLLDVIEQLCRPLVQADVQVVGVVCLPSFRSVFP